MEDLSIQEKSKKQKTTSSLKLTSYQKVMTVYILINLIILVTSVVLISKFKSQIQMTVDNINKTKTNQTETNNLMEYAALLEKQSKLVEEDFGEYMSLLVDRQNLPKTKQLITSICLKNKVDPLFTFNLENAAKDNEPSNYDFTLVLNGSFDNVVSSIREINSLPILITFNHVVIEKNTPLVANLPAVDSSSTSKPQSNPNDTTTTTKKVVKRIVKTTKPVDLFKVSILGKIYLRETLINDINVQNQIQNEKR